MQNKSNILYIDNKCLLCSNLAQWIIKIDKNKTINFSSLRSEHARANLPSSFQLTNESELSTVIYYDGKDYYQQSDAIIKLLRSLNGLWNMTIVLYFVPKFLRDGAYRLIARNRMKLFGQSDVCLLESNIPDNRIIK